MEKIVILLDGFQKTEAEAALAAYDRWGGDAERVTVAPVTDLSINRKTSEVVEDVAAGRWSGGNPRKKVRRGALIAAPGKSEAVALLKAFKSILPKDADSAFAMITETGKQWSVGYYLDHIHKEHDYMKDKNPEDDPDMRPVE